MFTGIVEAVGRITRVDPHPGTHGGVRLTIDPHGLDVSDVAIGDSVAINGACMTVVANDGHLAFDVSAESLRWIAGLSEPGAVNLECALRFGDRVGGHLVSGHVDGVSLTVNRIDGARFAVNLIPHTLAVTTLGSYAPGRNVNLEVDLLARHLERLLADRRA